jgi:hypothetical protein
LSIFPQEFRKPIMKEIEENKLSTEILWAKNGKTSAYYS